LWAESANGFIPQGVGKDEGYIEKKSKRLQNSELFLTEAAGILGISENYRM